MLRLSRAFGDRRGRPGWALAVFRGQAAHRRPRQQTCCCSWTRRCAWCGNTCRRPRRGTGCGSTFPLTRSSSITAPPSISNQEQNETIVGSSPTRQGGIIWSYGHPGRTGTLAPGHLSEPDDAYPLKNGQVTVADAQNCLVLVINHNQTVADQDRYQRPVRAPPADLDGLPERGHAPGRRQRARLGDHRFLGDRVHPGLASCPGRFSRRSATRRTPSSSDLTATSSPTTPHPGRSWSSTAPGGSCTATTIRPDRARPNHPSLAELLPSGVFMLNDDYNDRTWWPSTQPPGHWYGNTASMARQAPHEDSSTPLTASTYCCRTDQHPRTRRRGEKHHCDPGRVRGPIRGFPIPERDCGRIVNCRA